jgi:hypothetical protein
VPDGGVPLWEEFWTGGNSVQVSDGLFNVMLGSISNTLASAIEGHDELYLGITVGTDSEMVPRVQLGSVPFSMQAMTVPDGAIGGAQLADTFGESAKPLSNVIIELGGADVWQGSMQPGSGILDLTDQTSPSATAVILDVYVSDSFPNDRIRVFYPGEQDPYKKQLLWALRGGIEQNSRTMIVPCDANQRIEYTAVAEDQLDNVRIHVVGWIEPAK